MPAVGQGVLAIESREGDEQISRLMQKLDHLPTRWTVTAERSFLAAVQGGCQVPVAVYGTLEEKRLHLRALILSLDGKRFVADSISGKPEEAIEIGREMASRLMSAGGNEILQEIF